MARRDVRLIGSLVDYVLDVKPYHSKLREFASEIQFSEACHVNVADDHHLQLHFKNVWGRDDVGGQTLSIISEGSETDRIFKLPAAIWPHFTLNDSLNNGQTPPGDDPQGVDLSDYNEDGIPDYQDPILQDRRTSHFSGSDWIEVPAIITDVEFTFRRAFKNNGKGDTLVSNGYFDTNVTGWTPAGGCVATWEAGTLKVTNGTATAGYVKQDVQTVVGKTYILYVNRLEGTGTGLYTVSNAGNLSDTYALNSTDATVTFTARGTTTEIRLGVGGSTLNNYFTWDTVELYEYTVTQTYHCEYDLLVYVNGILESTYGFGNYWKAVVNERDVTYLSYRDNTHGAFDIDEFDDVQYDTETKTFHIDGLTASFTLTDADLAVAPWLNTESNSYVSKYWFAKHWPQVQIIYTNTGRYKVPFHQGSRVYVDGAPTVFGSTYVVESSRDFIQFAPGKHPKYNATISVNLMTVDRLFISETNPFDVNPTSNINSNWIPFVQAGYDDTIYQDLPYDTGLPLGICDYFTFKVDDIYPGRVSPVAFMNATLIGNKPIMTNLSVSTSAVNGEIYLVTATGQWTYTVQQVAPQRGPIQFGSFKQPFTNGKVSFTIDKDWTPYYIVPDPNSYSTYSSVYNVYEFKTVDPTDHLVDLGLMMQHGVVTDPTSDSRHRPVQFSSIGQVKMLTDSTGEEYYAFVLNEIPRRGVYYELRLEQSGGLNPRIHASITDEVVIAVFEAGNDFSYLEIYNSRNPIPDVFNADPGLDSADSVSYMAEGYVEPGYVE